MEARGRLPPTTSTLDPLPHRATHSGVEDDSCEIGRLGDAPKHSFFVAALAFDALQASFAGSKRDLQAAPHCSPYTKLLYGVPSERI